MACKGQVNIVTCIALLAAVKGSSACNNVCSRYLGKGGHSLYLHNNLEATTSTDIAVICIPFTTPG